MPPPAALMPPATRDYVVVLKECVVEVLADDLAIERIPGSPHDATNVGETRIGAVPEHSLGKLTRPNETGTTEHLHVIWFTQMTAVVRAARSVSAWLGRVIAHSANKPPHSLHGQEGVVMGQS